MAIQREATAARHALAQAILSRFVRLALVFFQVLEQSAYGTFLLAHGEFQLPVDSLASEKIAGPEQVEEKSGRLCQISENILYAGRKTVILRTVRHLTFLDAVERGPAV